MKIKKGRRFISFWEERKKWKDFFADGLLAEKQRSFLENNALSPKRKKETTTSFGSLPKNIIFWWVLLEA